jgi:hypothetical protein
LSIVTFVPVTLQQLKFSAAEVTIAEMSLDSDPIGVGDDAQVITQ